MRSLLTLGALVLAGCQAADVHLVEPLDSPEVRIFIHHVAGGETTIAAHAGNTAFRTPLNADATVWVMAYSVESLAAVYPGLANLSAEQVVPLIRPRLGQGAGCLAPPANTVLRSNGGEDYETITWQAWQSEQSARQIAPLAFEVDVTRACGESAFCEGETPDHKHIDFVAGGIVRTDSAAGLPSGDVPRTIEMWFSTDECDDGFAILGGFGNNSAGANFQLEMCARGNFWVMGWSIPRDWNTGVPSAPYLDGRWHHAAVTYEAGLTALYLDGRLAASTRAFRFDTDPRRVYIGREIDNSGRQYNGRLDEFRIWRRALSESEIRAAMHLKRPESLGDIAGHWTFDEEPFVFTPDQVANGNMLFILGAALRDQSTLPYGNGLSDQVTITGPGATLLPNTRVELDVTSSSTGTLVLTVLDQRPLGQQPFEATTVAARTWLVNWFGEQPLRYGLDLNVDGLDPADRADPGRLRLYRRELLADGVWGEVGAPASVGPSSVRFENVEGPGQFALVSLGSPSCCVALCNSN